MSRVFETFGNIFWMRLDAFECARMRLGLRLDAFGFAFGRVWMRLDAFGLRLGLRLVKFLIKFRLQRQSVVVSIIIYLTLPSPIEFTERKEKYF